jgi:hypothetical protein
MQKKKKKRKSLKEKDERKVSIKTLMIRDSLLNEGPFIAAALSVT